MERIQKFMARSGVASRRKCEEILLSGRVKVNGVVVSELGFKVSDEDKVYLDDKLLKPEVKKVYIALNKPVGYVSTVKDEKGRTTVIDLVNVDERIYPIGRLDYDTSGLILLTNDGDIYNKVIHPREEKNKVYRALLQGVLTREDIYSFDNGIDIGGYVTAPAKISTIKIHKKNTEVEITIHEGKNRQIRKMCKIIHHPVLKLERISIGKISLGNLEEGKWRYLTKDEIENFK